LIVNKYINIEKRLALNEYQRNKDKKKIKRITNDLYETEDLEKLIEKPIEKQQSKQPLITDEDFENK
jgi:ferredoxin-like protein FixX